MSPKPLTLIITLYFDSGKCCLCGCTREVVRLRLKQTEWGRDFLLQLCSPFWAQGPKSKAPPLYHSFFLLYSVPALSPSLSLSLTRKHTHTLNEKNQSHADLLIKHSSTSIFHSHFARRYCIFGLTVFYLALIWNYLHDILTFLIEHRFKLPLTVHCFL